MLQSIFLNNLIKFVPAIAIIFALLVLPQVAFGAPLVGDTATNLVPNDTLGKVDNIVEVIRGVIRFILVVAFVIAFIMLIVGGIRWILAGGDEKSVEKARNTITAALIGLVIVLVAYALIRLVEIFFNVQIITGGVKIPTINTQ